MSKMLLLVDCQCDFMEGGKLAVAGATEKMDKLAEYVRRHGQEYDRIAFTVDFHPHNHCSFKKNGGQWPEHCVQYSTGASIYEPVLSAANKTGSIVAILRKGQDPERENYSVFQDDTSAMAIEDWIWNGIDEVDVAGIAMDYCVKETMKDGLDKYPNVIWSLLYSYCPIINDSDFGGKVVSELMEGRKNFRVNAEQA